MGHHLKFCVNSSSCTRIQIASAAIPDGVTSQNKVSIMKTIFHDRSCMYTVVQSSELSLKIHSQAVWIFSLLRVCFICRRVAGEKAMRTRWTFATRTVTDLKVHNLEKNLLSIKLWLRNHKTLGEPPWPKQDIFNLGLELEGNRLGKHDRTFKGQMVSCR